MKILKSRKLLISILALIFIFAVSAFGLSFVNKNANAGWFLNGFGTSEKPFKIYNKDELNEITDLNYYGAYFLLMNDIDLEGADLESLFDETDPFIGIFDVAGFNGSNPFVDNFVPDGNGKKIISNFKQTTCAAGLFGVIGKEGVVKNLGLVNYIIDDSYSGGFAFGGFASINKGLIENCYVSSEINSSETENDIAGGLVGLNCGKINNCYNESSVAGNVSIGGIAGQNGCNDDYYDEYQGIITNCYNIGKITNIQSSSAIGGIAGTNYGSISCSFNVAEINNDHNTGGIAGLNYGLIDRCFNSGNIMSSADLVGGIAGMSADNQAIGVEARITNCYNTGLILTRYNNGGGIVKYSSHADILNCYDTGCPSGIAHGSWTPVADTFFNSDNCEYSEYGKGLITEEMTADDVLTAGEMASLQNSNYEGEIWIKPIYNDGYRYYPELKVFYESDNPIIRHFSRLSVSTGNISFTVQVNGWTYGQTANTPVIDVPEGYVDMPGMIQYKLLTEPNSAYDANVPVNAGKYVVRVTLLPLLPEDFNISATAIFTIAKAELTVTADDKFALMDELDSIEYTYMIAGFKYDDKEKYNNNPLSVITGAFEFEVSTPGGYGSYETDIKILQGTAAAVNYYFTFIDGTLTITGDESILTEPEVTGVEFTYNGSEQGPIVNDSEGYTISGDISETNAGLYKLIISLNDGYKWSDGTTDDLVIDWEIKKADPSYTVPVDLEAKIGDKLSDISLAAYEGFSWNNGTIVLDTCGYTKIMATYTPVDTDNYNIITNIEITIAVAQVVEEIRFVQSKEYSYTYGDLLSKLNDLLAEEKANVSGTFAFKNANEKLYAGMTSVKVVFTSDSGNEAEFDLRISVAKAQAAAPETLPSGLTAKVGDRLSSITLPYGFSWQDVTYEFKNTGEIEVTAIYNPDPDNFHNVDVKLTITVSEAEPEDLGLNPAQIGLIIGAIGLVVLGAILMIVFITRRRKQKQG